MTEGWINIIDATPAEAVQSGPGKTKDCQDKDAGWHVKNDSKGRQKSTYGYSVHTGVEEDGLFIGKLLQQALCMLMQLTAHKRPVIGSNDLV